MGEWFVYRVVLPLVPVAIQYIAYDFENRPMPFPPLTMGVVTCLFPLVTAKDYKKDQLLYVAILPSTFTGLLFFLAVIRYIETPLSTSKYLWYAFFVWLLLLLVNLFRKLDKL